MATEEFERLVDESRRAPFIGWDFSWLKGRAKEDQPPWRFASDAATLLAGSSSALDIDTGGGEALAALAPFPGRVVATEGYEPNIAVAVSRLRPLGVQVVGTESAPDNVEQYPLSEARPSSTSSYLPFRDAAFDLVLNRHSSYWPSEVARVLSHQGTFLTQQRSVGNAEFMRLFGFAPPETAEFDLAFAVEQLERAGFAVERAEEAQTPMRFFDIGALAFYLRAVPWVVPGFDVQAHGEVLLRLHQQVQAEGEVRLAGQHMLIQARKDA
jgi:SAM-dependent methyltransferase